MRDEPADMLAFHAEESPSHVAEPSIYDPAKRKQFRQPCRACRSDAPSRFPLGLPASYTV